MPKSGYRFGKETNRHKNLGTICSSLLIILALLFKIVTTESTAMVIPHLRSMAFIPAKTDLQPSE
ncbi:hypothetical protein HanLR1_Chr02g0051261 [Helianthus annuus]|nr:hypothetical protein HanHA89_Chr02g0053681 [Helianthus annuus]KAJ0776922.1 hypothetical protein HanLR1_Chr02g0051261 [Helianthus annuus]